MSQTTPVNEPVFRMGVILFFTQLLMCILGCLYFGWATSHVDDMCPDQTRFHDEILGEEMWIAEDYVITDVMNVEICGNVSDIECDSCPQSLFFVRSVYFLMQTLFTIGYGDPVVPSHSQVEIALGCVFVVFGVFGYGLIIANMTSVLSNLDVVNMRFRHEMDRVNRWMLFRSVPSQLREQIEMFYTHLLRIQDGMMETAFLSELPPQLSRKFSESHIPLLAKIPFFNPNYRSKRFLSHVSASLIRRIYPPGSYLMNEGERQRELFIVKSGRVELMKKGTSDPVGSLVDGDYIGDFQMLFGTTNQLGVQSPDFTEILVLTYQHLKDIVNQYDQGIGDLRLFQDTFRKSDDQGVIDTIDKSKIFFAHISSNIMHMTTTSKKLKDMMAKNEITLKGFRIAPSSPIHVYWDIFSLVAILYYATSSPIRFAKYFRSGNLRIAYDWFFLIDYALDLLFMIDVYLRMNVYAFQGFETGHNLTVVDRHQMQENYMRSHWFRVDCIAIIPYDIISIGVGYHTLARIPKLVRIFHVSRIVERLQKNLDDCLHISMNESHVSGSIMLLYSLLIIIWSSSGWNAIRTDENLFESVYWALTTLTTVGYGDFAPSDFRETCYALVVGAVGATFTAGIIANVTSFFHDVDISENNITHKMNCVKHYMEQHSCKFEEIRRIQDYFDYIEREQEGFDEHLLLHEYLPDHIKTQCLIHLTQSMVTNCALFVGCEPGFLHSIMTSLEQRFFGSDCMILSSSSPSDGMYFIKKGVVELGKEVNKSTFHPIKRLENDENFGQQALMQYQDKSSILARAITDCELWFLSRITFNQFLKESPHSKDCIGEFSNSSFVASRRASVAIATKAIQKSLRSKAFYIHPEGDLIQCWFIVVLILTIYNIIAVPFRLAFLENHGISVAWAAFDYTGDCLLLVDIMFRARLLAFYEDTNLVVDRHKIWHHYLQSGKLKWHVLAILPLDIAFAWNKSLCPLWELQTWSLFRINKLFRIAEVKYLLNRLEALAQTRFKVPKNALRVGKLMAVIMLSAHMVACVFYSISFYNHHAGMENWANDQGLFSSEIQCPGDSVDANIIMRRYISSLYWSMATLTTVGYGDITAHKDSIMEITFASLILVIGTAIYTMVIALLEDIVSQVDVTSSLHKMNTEKIDLYVSSQCLPDTLKTRVSSYYDHIWKLQRGVNSNKLVTFFPRLFWVEIMRELLSPLFRKTFFIKDCRKDFLSHIIKFITPQVYLPEDNLFFEGERCECLHFICKGEVELLTSNGVHFKTMSSCVIGEESFFGLEPYFFSARAGSTCEIFSLNMTDFFNSLGNLELLHEYKDYLTSHQDKLILSKASLLKMIKNLKSSKMKKMLNSKEELSIPSGILLPDLLKRQIWDIFALIFVTVFTFTIPYQISFSSSSKGWSQFSMDTLLDMFFICDVYARSTRFAVVKDGFIITEPKEFRQIYLKGEFVVDFITIVPASTIAFTLGATGEVYGLLRILQLLRVIRFGKYLNRTIETIDSRTSFTLSTALIRVMEIFFVIVFLAHWFACTFHFIGNPRSTGRAISSWVLEDDLIDEKMSVRYLRSFYWALYTVSTIGYGSVPVVTIGERLFAMLVMVVGAVICDAVITAILTSIISIRDQQAGTNSRRIQCSKRYMTTRGIEHSIQSQVIDFYNYVDNELGNIQERNILDNVSVSIKNDVLNFFCFDALRAIDLLSEHTNGAVRTLVNSMNPHLAIPGECVLKIGEPCEDIFILQRGVMKSLDSSGLGLYLPIGSVMGHPVSRRSYEIHGLPSTALNIKLHSMHGLKAKHRHVNPYIKFNAGSLCCRSSVKRASDWTETLLLKLPDGYHQPLCINLKTSQKERLHSTIGTAQVSLFEAQSEWQLITLQDTDGKAVGKLKLQIEYRDLLPAEMVNTHELTSVAKSYCHLYRLDHFRLTDLTHYMRLAGEEDMTKRFTGQKLSKNQRVDRLNDSDIEVNGLYNDGDWENTFGLVSDFTS